MLHNLCNMQNKKKKINFSNADFLVQEKKCLANENAKKINFIKKWVFLEHQKQTQNTFN